MHELSICRSIAGIVDRNRNGRTVQRVGIQLGALRQAVPDTLTSCWELLTERTPLAGSVLDFQIVALVIRCRDCGTKTRLDQVHLLCPACGGQRVDVVQGEEFCVTYLDLDDESPPAQ